MSKTDKVRCLDAFKYMKCMNCKHTVPHDVFEDPKDHPCTEWGLCYTDVENDEYVKVHCNIIRKGEKL